MNEQTWTAVDNFFSHSLIGEDQILTSILKNNSENGLPAWDVSPNQGKLLQLMVSMIKAKKILEIGTLGAYSTVWMARGFPPGEGKIITIEKDPAFAEVARTNIEKASFTKQIDVRVGTALDILKEIEKENSGAFDLIFIDADKINNPNYFTWGKRLGRKGTIIIVDNVVRSGAILNESSTDPSVQGVQSLTSLISNDSKVVATAVQTVGTKGWDGFIIAQMLAD